MSAERQWPERLHAKGNILLDDVFEFINAIEGRENTKLVFDLLQNYVILNNYHNFVIDMAIAITQAFGRDDRLLILPIDDQKSDSVKSGHSVSYELKAQLDPKDFRELIFPNSISHFRGNLSNYKIIVVDDFIGSGSQFRKFSGRIQREFGVRQENISVYTIVLMASRRARVEERAARVCASLELPPSLAQLKTNGVNNAYELYDSIESKLSMPPMYRRGYSRTEACVTMKRTPNNTLPIFWHDRLKGGQQWPAPFKRY